MKIKSITIEIHGEDKTLTMDEAKALYQLLGEVLESKNDSLKRLLDEARKHSKTIEKVPVYIPMPYPVYPAPAIPAYPSPFYYKYSMTDNTKVGDTVTVGNSAGVKLLGCTVQQ